MGVPLLQLMVMIKSLIKHLFSELLEEFFILEVKIIKFSLMKNRNILGLVCLLLPLVVWSQDQMDSLLPVRGFCIEAPRPENLNDFIEFMEHGLASSKVNVVILRIDYNYQYKTHPELKDDNALSANQVKLLVETAKQSGIRIIPQINLLGHQSWAETTNNLLKIYPEFDETPHVSLPEKYSWPNEDSLYCKSYCPRHPEVHDVVFDLVDEILDIFEADAFHAGLDEVFYIGDDSCPRCSGKNKAELFAGEVNLINSHLKKRNCELWMWGDRLLDGKNTGLGMWEASANNTHGAIDLISKDIVICDWHYERAEPTAAYFALKGFNVVTCPWNNAEVALKQLEQTLFLRTNANQELAGRIKGMVQTIWSPAENFLTHYDDAEHSESDSVSGPVNCYLQLFTRINQIQN